MAKLRTNLHFVIGNYANYGKQTGYTLIQRHSDRIRINCQVSDFCFSLLAAQMKNSFNSFITYNDSGMTIEHLRIS